MLLLVYPISLNLTSKQQKMKTELTAYTNTDNTNELTNTAPTIATVINTISYSPTTPCPSSQRQLIIPIMPVTITIPQNTRSPLIMSETYIRPKNLERMPIVVLAELMQLYPVTDITITQLWLRIFSKFYILAKQHETKQRQMAAAMFLFYLLLASISILAKVTIATRIDPNTIDPKEEVKIHLYAVNKKFLPQTLQYQKEQATAIVNTMMQQKTKPKKSHTKNHKQKSACSALLFSPFLTLSSETAIIELNEQIQNNPNPTLISILIIGLMNTPHFSLMNCDAILISMIPMSICFLKHSSTIPQIKKIMRKVKANAQSLQMNPTTAKPNNRVIDRTIRTYTIILGINFIRKTQVKLKTTAIPKHTPIQSARSYIQKLPVTILTSFSWMQYAPVPTNRARISKNTATQPTSLHVLFWTGSDLHWLHLESYSCWYAEQSVIRVSLIDMIIISVLSFRIIQYGYFQVDVKPC